MIGATQRPLAWLCSDRKAVFRDKGLTSTLIQA